jgi:hypothetical protein
MPVATEVEQTDGTVEQLPVVGIQLCKKKDTSNSNVKIILKDWNPLEGSMSSRMGLTIL